MPNYNVTSSEQDPVYTTITDGTDNLEIEDGALETIDFTHCEIHEGNHFTISRRFIGIANDGYARIHLLTGSTKQTHLISSIQTEAKAYVNFYRNTTYSNNGTTLNIYNNNEFSTTTSTCTAYYTPTISVTGTLLFETMIPAGKSSQAIGGETVSRNELILKTNTDYLVEVQNKGGIAADVGISLYFYEL